MSPSRLTVFVSSTVRDFGPVRRDVKTWLEQRGMVARLSEYNDFPVARGVHSHEACLHAIRGSHLYVLLVGDRYGGRYRGTPKSITWREYDEAFQHEIPSVVLVLRETNERAIALSKVKAGGKPDKILEDAPKDFEQIASFIDHVRQRPRDNWMYMEWDGSATYATEVIQNTLNDLVAFYQGPHVELRRAATAATARAAALRDMQVASFELALAVRRGEQPVSEAMARLLALAASARRELFTYTDDDVWNLMVYRRDGETLVPWVRHCDKRIARKERRWTVGEGHVGLAVSSKVTLVAGDLPVADGWVAGSPADAEVYRSAVSVPLFSAPTPVLSGNKKTTRGGVAEPIGAVVLTSSRLDHFLDPGAPEVLTAEQLCTMLRAIATAAPEGGAQ